MAARKKSFTVYIEYGDSWGAEPSVAIIHQALAYDNYGDALFPNWGYIEVSPND